VHRTLDGVGHFPHQEAPQHVADALLDFLDQ
jgi:pimeloyl-ACP methyl ester carboxylesterase